jgi:signal transduction histidine kinase
VRPEDFVWLVLFGAMIVFSPDPTPAERVFLPLLGALQIVEPKLAFFQTRRGIYLSSLVKLLAANLLIGFTGGVSSSYYLILLLPVVTAASSLGALGTAIAILGALGCYLSFLLFIDWRRYTIDFNEFGLRLSFLALIGYLTHRLAEVNRVAAQRHRVIAEQLTEANTSLQEAEAAVRRSERLAALGQLSAGLAHELRNPLGTIKASADLLMKQAPQENELAQELTSFISAEVDRTNSLVTRFLDFARPLELRLSSADFTEIIDRAVARLERHSPPFQVSIYKNYSPDIQPFFFDEELMERVIYNLLLNAAQATPPGGVITVKTRQANGDVEVAIIDRGAGIDPGHLENIFNPFFTTKTDGTGLGLAIVSKIVDQHGGGVSVESEPGKGSIFRVSLPARREGL